MGFDKGHHEFHTLDMNDGWHAVPGYPPGFHEKILAGSLDEKNRRGNRTRLVRIESRRSSFRFTPNPKHSKNIEGE